jgi:hypothetical protein
MEAAFEPHADVDPLASDKSRARTASARTFAPRINCMSVSGIEGTPDSTARATTSVPPHDASTVATRAQAARTAMILAARAEPRATIIRVILGCVTQCARAGGAFRARARL